MLIFPLLLPAFQLNKFLFNQVKSLRNCGFFAVQRLFHKNAKDPNPMACYPESPFKRVDEFRIFLKKSLLNSWLLKGNGSEEDKELNFQRLEKWLTRPPKYTTIRFNTNKLDQSSAITKLKEILSSRCHRFPVESLSIQGHSILKDLLVITNGGYYDKIENLKPYGKPVIIDLRAGQSVLRGSEIYVGGIIGATADLRKLDKVAVYVDIEGKCLKGWKRPYKGAKVFIGNGISLYNRRDIFNDNPPQGIGVQLTDCLYPAPSLYGNMNNLFFAQNFPSMVTVHALEVSPGQVILDMCAAPGGKTTHIASLMNLTGTLIACDVSKSRIDKLKANLERWEMDQFVSVFTHDCTKPINIKDGQTNSSNQSHLEPPFCEETFDRILLDAPCSGLGQRPQLVGDRSLASFLSYPKVQSRLIENAVKLLKPGGILIYSTCSFTIEENEAIVSKILHDHPDLSLEHQSPYLFGQPGFEGAHNLTSEDLLKVQRFIGSYDIDAAESDTIGFTISKLRKDK
ncbi:putative methyltransferase NSUN6 [Tetranychus urticae]|uniref:putative methyltransferase NSUN6 n=1 Tax=Tetranychus urticae TaxID=32264 RepID=UPI00077BDCF1|nr:putative methyltransferase NSUN6 [Tetranychus urticae]